MAYSTFSLAMIGVFTENSPYNLHLIFSYGFFLLFPLAMIILSTTFFKSNFYFFILTILMAFVAIGVIINLPLGNGKAIPEILEAIFLVIWISIFDILMYEHKF